MHLLSNSALTLCLLVFCIGCEQSPRSIGQSGNTDSDAVAKTVVPPHHKHVEVFINTRLSPDNAFDNEHGCVAGYSPQSETIKDGLICRYPGAVSKFSCEYSHSDDNGDHYHFQRVFPHGEPNQKTSEVDVVFNGEEVVLFKDDLHRIVLRLMLPKD